MVNVPAHDRPRERLLAQGATGLGDRELLAVLLGTGGATGVGAQELAERLLGIFGSLPAVSRATAADLQKVRGVGGTKAARLVAAFEVARRAAQAPSPRRIGGTADIADVVSPLLHGHTRERLLVVSCSSGLRVLGVDMVSEGAVDETLFPVREIMVAVLRRDGRRFALAHNHPSGDPTPSKHDIEATRLIDEAAAVAGLGFLDHVIVSDTGWSRAGPPPARKPPAKTKQKTRS
jgi:DNA repair protein RadC